MAHYSSANMSFSSYLDLAAFALVSGALALTLYTVCLIAYRLFLHPLSEYPGPFLAKITDLHSTYYAWAGTRHLDLLKQHDKYGPVFRYGPNKLSFNTHTAYKSIHGVNANVRKSDLYLGFYSPLSSIFGAIDKNVHARKRRILGSAFTDKAMKSMEEQMFTHTRIFCQKLASTEEPLNMAHMATYLTGDMLGDLCFGRSFETQTRSENRFALETIAQSAAFTMVCGAGINLRGSLVSRMLFRRLMGHQTNFRSFARAQAVARMAMTGTDRKDFYHYLIEAKNSTTDEKYEPSEIWVESNTLIAAGADTSATVLAATFFYLTRYPAVMRKLQEEIRSTFKGSDVEEIKWGPELRGCNYLRAVLDESMRITPAVPGLLPRTVLPGGIEFDGVRLAEGTEVGVGHYAIHHNELYFPDSFSFLPERWILSEDASDAEKEQLRIRQQAFVPFSIGSRGCIGKNMAIMEMMTTMARVIFLFDFEAEKSADGKLIGGGFTMPGKGGHMEYQVQDMFVCEKDGPMISFTPRKI